jgi:hypothetical protein
VRFHVGNNTDDDDDDGWRDDQKTTDVLTVVKLRIHTTRQFISVRKSCVCWIVEVQCSTEMPSLLLGRFDEVLVLVEVFDENTNTAPVAVATEVDGTYADEEDQYSEEVVEGSRNRATRQNAAAVTEINIITKLHKHVLA